MATLEFVEERIISGKGVFKITNIALLNTARYYLLYLDLIRPPASPYLNNEWNPSQSVYARIVYRRNAYVIADDIMRYKKELRTYVNDNSGQVLRAVKCAYEGTLQSFVNLATGLGAGVVSVTNSIIDYQSLALGWDEILFSCYGGSAVQARIYRMPYDVCNAANEDTSNPGAPPAARPSVPYGTGITDISQPYDTTTNDGGSTVPFGSDSYPAPGTACQRVRVFYTRKLQGSPQGTGSVIVFARIGGVITIKSTDNKVAQMYHQGSAPTGQPTEICGAYQLRDLVSFSDPIESISFNSSAPV